MPKQKSKQNYWDQAQKGAQEEGGLGKPVIARGRVDLGYFAFAPGFSGEDRKECIFLPKSGKDGREKARLAAQKLCQDNGKNADSARWCIITTIYQNEAMYADGNEIDTWNGDQVDPIPLWPVWDKQGKRREEPSAGGLIWDAVNSLKLDGGKDFYGLFGWQADPYKLSLGEAGKTKESRSGDDDTVTMQYPVVCVVQEVFANKGAAAKAVGTPAVASDGYTWAEGWTEDDLAEMVNTLTTEKGNYDDFATLVEDEAGEDVAWGVKLLSEVGEMDTADIVKFTDLKAGKVRKALKK